MVDRVMEWLASNIQNFWIPLSVLAAAAIGRLLIHRYVARWAKRRDSEWARRFVDALESASTPLLLIAVLYILSYGFELSADAMSWLRRGLGILAIIVVMPAARKLVSIGFELLAEKQKGMDRYIQPLRTLATAAIILTGVALGLRILNIDLSNDGLRFVRTVGIALGGFIALRIVNLAVAKMESLVDDDNPDIASEAEKRARTLGRILNSAAFVIVSGVVVMMVLSEFGMNIMPIITGAGIAGLAFGFGAQNLVRDIISGFFLILENQVRIGDVAIINGTGGIVEAINLRTIVLRDLQGVVHIFPNGEVTQVSNMTKEWSRYVIDVGVAYKESVDHVMKVLEEIGEDLCNDETFKPLILDKLEILGVDDFGESQITIKVMIKTLPLKQWFVGRELRRRIKNTFDRKGIEIPFPHMSVYFGEASKPFDLMLNRAQPKVQKAG